MRLTFRATRSALFRRLTYISAFLCHFSPCMLAAASADIYHFCSAHCPTYFARQIVGQNPIEYRTERTFILVTFKLLCCAPTRRVNYRAPIDFSYEIGKYSKIQLEKFKISRAVDGSRERILRRRRETDKHLRCICASEDIVA